MASDDHTDTQQIEAEARRGFPSRAPVSTIHVNHFTWGHRR